MTLYFIVERDDLEKFGSAGMTANVALAQLKSLNPDEDVVVIAGEIIEPTVTKTWELKP